MKVLFSLIKDINLLEKVVYLCTAVEVDLLPKILLSHVDVVGCMLCHSHENI